VSSSIALVGESLTDKDEDGPFGGAVGWHLDQMLAAAGIRRRDCLVTTVFNMTLPKGDVKYMCGPKTEGIPGRGPLLRGKYVRREYASHLERLDRQLDEAEPNVVVCFGPTALWALTGEIGIRSARGVTRLSHSRRKVVPTYQPGAVLRQYNLRPIVIADLCKAKEQSAFPEYQPPERRIHIAEGLRDLFAFAAEHFTAGTKLACDIETKQEQITCIGFSPDPSLALVIPFFRHDGSNYWPTHGEELAVWNLIREWLATYPTVYQNGVYDISYLWRVYGIPAPLACDDTMLLHHALQPEMDKGLGFLASLYTNEPSWKQMGKGQKHD
jgi:uracil-DNA glycosylase